MDFFRHTGYEIRRIFSRKLTMAILGASALAPGIFATAALIVHRRSGRLLFESHDFPLWILGFFTEIFLPLFIFLWVSDVLGAEESLHRHRKRHVQTVSDGAGYGALLLSMVLCAGFCLLLVFFFSEIAALFLSILGTGIPGNVSLTMTGYLVDMIPIISLIMAALFLAQVVRSGFGAMSVNILFFLAMRSLYKAMPDPGWIIPFSFTSWHWLWLDTIPAWHQIGLGALNMTIYGLVSVVAGYYCYQRKHR